MFKKLNNKIFHEITAVADFPKKYMLVAKRIA
jgi:hypothetical protein